MALVLVELAAEEVVAAQQPLADADLAEVVEQRAAADQLTSPPPSAEARASCMARQATRCEWPALRGSLRSRAWIIETMMSSAVSSSSRSRLMRTSERTRARSSWTCTGLLRKSSAPASKAYTLSSTADSAVSITTGMKRVERLALSRRQTSKPSIPGIITSSTMQSGGSAATAASALSPSAASWMR